jgi:protein TonB
MGVSVGGERPPLDPVPRAHARFKQRSRIWFWIALLVAALVHLLIFWLDPQFRVAEQPPSGRAETRAVNLLPLPRQRTVKLEPREERVARGGRPATKRPPSGRSGRARPIPAPPREPAAAPPELTEAAEEAVAAAQRGVLGAPLASLPGPALAVPGPPIPPPPQPESELDRFVPVNPSMEKPDLVNRAQVKRALYREYPRALQSAGIGGAALVWFWIDEKGKVVKYEIRQSSGQPALDAAAERVIPLMKFRPAKRNGKAIPVIAALPIRFEVD